MFKLKNIIEITIINSRNTLKHITFVTLKIRSVNFTNWWSEQY